MMHTITLAVFLFLTLWLGTIILVKVVYKNNIPAGLFIAFPGSLVMFIWEKGWLH